MEILKTGIYLKDLNFAFALVKSLARECGNMNFVILESDVSIGDYDLILTDYNFDKENCITLIDEEKYMAYEAPYSLFKYCSSSKMINYLFLIFFHISGRNIEIIGSRQCKTIAFTSLGGGYGSTSTAIAVSDTIVSDYGFKCLYINLSGINDSRKYFGNIETNDTLKLSYYLKYKEGFPLTSFITGYGNIDYLNIGTAGETLGEIFGLLTAKVEALGIYNFLILDIGNNLTTINRKIMENCSGGVILASAKSMLPKKYKENVDRILNDLFKSSFLLNVVNYASETETYSDETMIISEDNEAFRITEEHIYMDYLRNYGNEIQLIGEKIVEAAYGQ